MSDLELYEPSSSDAALVREVIREQGVIVCRNTINKSWINRALSEAEFGFVRYISKAQIGRRSLKRPADRFMLHGFVLCHPQSALPGNPRTIIMDLVCSRPNSHTGILLIECAEQEARDRAYQQIKLFCVPAPRLRQYYESLGYAKVADVPDFDPSSSGAVKAYEMTKLL